MIPAAYPLAPPRLSWRFTAVWRRMFLVWQKLAVPSMLGNLADPMIYMLGFGYGLGRLLPEVNGVPYIVYLAAGTVCFSTMNRCSSAERASEPSTSWWNIIRLRMRWPA